MEFCSKIDNILKAKGFKLWRLAKLTGLNTTLEKAYQANRDMNTANTALFLKNAGISPEWWQKGTGNIFVSHSAEETPRVLEVLNMKNGRHLIPAADPEYIYLHRAAYEQLEETLHKTQALLAQVTANNTELVKSIGELIKNVAGTKA